jgi:hypothetical protein
MNKAVEWLLHGPAWVRYPALIDLLDKPENDGEVAQARQQLMDDIRIKELLKELSDWPGPALKRHNDAGHLLHKLVFVSELGFKSNDPIVGKIVDKVLRARSEEGPFQVTANISPHFGGTGQDQPAWMLCDSPSIIYALIKLGLKDREEIKKAARYLAGLSFSEGWPCVVSANMGKFRGPGRKDDPCPYATLISLKALAQIPEWRDSEVCRKGAESLLNLWEKRKERRPYLFAMGTDFCKLKAPLIWYDVLHTAETLSQFPWLHSDKRFNELIDILKAKAGSEGIFTPESVWKAWSDWDFGQKKKPSEYLTLCVLRVFKRINQDR